MDKRPIGVFDSGIGGITAVKKLREVLPNEDILYLGDTLRAPYGSRPLAEIIQFASEEAAFLAKLDVKAMIIACNTICFSSHEIIQGQYDIPVYDVIGPAAEAAVAQSKSKRIGVIATPATIKSGAYEAAIKKVAPDAEVFSTACPRFVPLVESGRTSPEDAEVFTAASEYLSSFDGTEIDTLVLGCTHYPLLSEVIGQIMGPGVALINSGAEVIGRVAEELRDNDALNPDGGTAVYYVTGDTDIFTATASKFLGLDLGESVKQATLG